MTTPILSPRPAPPVPPVKSPRPTPPPPSPPSPATGPRLRLGDVLLAGASMLPAAAALGALFDGYRYLAPLAGAVAAAAVVGTVAARRLATVELVCLVGALAGLLYGTGVAAGRVDLLLRALRDGWRPLLTTAVPAEPNTLLLAPLGAVLWVATFAAVVLVVRWHGALLPALPPLLVTIGFLLLVAEAGQRRRVAQLVLTGCFVVLVLVLAAVRSARAGVLPGQSEPTGGGPGVDGRSGPGHRSRLAGPLAIGLPVVATVAVLATVVGVVVPIDSADRYDLREHSSPPVDDVALLNPLVQVRAQLDTPEPTKLFTIRLTPAAAAWPAGAPGTSPRVRTAALGAFDGATWSVDGNFIAVDKVLPGPEEPVATTVARARVRADVTFDGFDDALLPTLGEPTAIDYATASGSGPREGRGPAFEPTSGTLALLSPPRAGDRFDLTAQVSRPSDAQLAAAVVATGPGADRYRVLPNLPDDLRAELLANARQTTAGAATTYGKLVALADFLRDGNAFPYDLHATPGHSYGRLTRLLDSADPADHRGYAEQRAAAFAVLARSLGFPTRISVGYLLDEDGAANTTDAANTDGTFTVTDHQAHAWPEVLFAGIGWVAFEPTDTSDLSRAGSRDAPLSGASPPQTQQGDEENPAVITPAQRDIIVGGDDGRGGRLAWPFVLLIALGALALALPLLVIGEKARRRLTRRHRGGPADRVRGAWWEARDRLGEFGVSRSPSLTRRELVGAVARNPATAPAVAPLRLLAALVDEATFALGGTGADDPDRAWALVGDVRRELGRAAGRAGRVRALLDPHPLFAAPAAGADAEAAAVAPPTGPAVTPAAVPPVPASPSDFLQHWVQVHGQQRRTMAHAGTTTTLADTTVVHGE
ncbi:transglutaminase-like domain-containing protein [Pseudofrankia sp. BMG5.37]|uniref:transglutaminase-like domain-containing protein n=1 Tax=Pseudofrankia sp. BMG5.37 TaxID=3050035 RepID=UPI0028953CA4|nr:transglutaminase-like domain-containing protein [Pseudofrankia sp. BMG5.37]MDT3442477.1 transglutaminase-like domain-containing protein [Pseudofrankia sp. BMG5.37]